MQFSDVCDKLERIGETLGTKAKRELLCDFLSEVDEFARLLSIFYEHRVYGVSTKTLEKCVPEKLRENPYEDIGELWSRFRTEDMYRELNKSPLTIEFVQDVLSNVEEKSGLELQQYLQNVYDISKPSERMWLARFLLHDLRIGIQDKTIRDAFFSCGIPHFIVEHFGVQLCGSINSVYDWSEFPVYVSVKYDGFRCMIEKSGDNITLTSRQGKDVSYFLPEIVEEVKKIPFDVTLDGEILAKTFNDVQKRIGRKGDIRPIEDLHFRAFDILTYDTEILSYFTERQRYESLGLFFNQYNSLAHHLETDSHKTRIRIEERYEVNTQDELKILYNQFCERKLEGAILKRTDAPYCKNSRDNWFKLKPSVENSFIITNVSFGTGRNSKRISKITVSNKSGSIVAGVGSGFSDEDVKHMTEEGNAILGRIVDVQYNEISKNEKGQYSLRFPRFLKFRDDKNEADEIEPLQKE